MDPTNPIVRLCIEGMTAESRGHPEEASRCFDRAWQAAGEDYERCIAAHYVARHQPSEVDRMTWNRRALEAADRVGDGRVSTLYPSLLLNLGHSLEVTGDPDGARNLYLRARRWAEGLPRDAYGTMVLGGIEAGLDRIGAQGPGDADS
jgi:hypothetical protein